MKLIPKLISLSLVLLVTLAADIDTVRERRYAEIVGSSTGASSIPTWLSTIRADGSWPDLDYTTGCDAQTGSWPAQRHWERIQTFAAAWHGGFKNALEYAGNTTLRSTTSLAMSYWFDNDFTVPACLDSGGTDSCPCGTPGFWTKNWYDQIILIPTYVGEVGLLLGSSLSADELNSCELMTRRAYNTFQTGVNGVSSITGSNLLDIASVGIDLGLLTANTSLVTDAFDRVHGELAIENGIKADGIRADGSFGQHSGLLYNGNYGKSLSSSSFNPLLNQITGKDYLNDILNLDIAAGGTQFEANSTAQDAVTTLLSGDAWMVFQNTITGVSHWDYSVVGRVISLPVADNQATANLKINLTQIQVLGQEWGSTNVTQVFDDLSESSDTPNIGSLTGNRMFFTNDYMVQRGENYVTTLKMYSKRTQNTECVNAQNPYGFHLSDGTMYNYITGDEYEDIFAAWDWNLIPGITVDYNNTLLNCTGARKTGTQAFVGGASDGQIGIAAMRYETPTSKDLNWRKTFFFLNDDVQFVMVARITSASSSPVYTVLDQRKHVGDVFVSGVASGSGNYTSATSLWHGGVGYIFNTSDPVTLSVELGVHTGSWQAIGTSTQPPASVDLFAAWLAHDDLSAPISYAIYPATSSSSEFEQKAAASQIQSVRNDGSISALLDIGHATAMIAFWETNGGSVTIPSPTGDADVKVQSTGSSLLILNMNTWSVTLSEPTQILANLNVTVSLGSGSIPAGWTGTSKTKTVIVNLPAGGVAGSSVTMNL